MYTSSTFEAENSDLNEHTQPKKKKDVLITKKFDSFYVLGGTVEAVNFVKKVNSLKIVTILLMTTWMQTCGG